MENIQGEEKCILMEKLLQFSIFTIYQFTSRPKGVKMGIGRALLLTQALLLALLLPPASAASLLLAKCHLAATFLTLATSLLPALVVSYGPQLAGPLPATFTFSNR